MNQGTATLIGSVVAVVFALSIIVVRVRAARKPTNAKKILIPPIMMSTGFTMYFAPETHEPFAFAAMAFIVGLALSYPLIATSRMFVRDGAVYLKRSKGFIFILLGLLALRIILHSVVEQYVNVYQTGSLFFVLAFGMILPWRVAMFVQFRKLVHTPEVEKTSSEAGQLE